MGPLILLLGIAVVALLLVAMVWRKARATTRSESSGDGGDAGLLDESGAAPSARHSDGQCADAGSDGSSGDCGSDGGSGGD